MATGPWSVTTETVEKNPSDDGTNQSGIIIYVSDGKEKKEVSRVGFIRRNSKNPKTSFEKQMQKELAKAEKLVQVLNDTFQLDPTQDLL